MQERTFPAPVAYVGALKEAWFLYRATIRRAFWPMLAGFSLLGLIPFLFLLDLPTGTEIGVVILTQVVAPVALAGLFFAILAHVMGQELAGHRVTMRQGWAAIRPQLRNVLAGSLLSAAAVLVLLFVLGPVIFLLFTAFMGPPILVQVLALEHRSLGGGAKRTRELLALQWSRVVLYLIGVSTGINVLSSIPLRLVADALTTDSAAPLLGFAFFTAQSFFAAALFPFVASVGLVLYLDLRARSEQLDADGWAAEIGSTGS